MQYLGQEKILLRAQACRPVGPPFAFASRLGAAERRYLLLHTHLLEVTPELQKILQLEQGTRMGQSQNQCCAAGQNSSDSWFVFPEQVSFPPCVLPQRVVFLFRHSQHPRQPLRDPSPLPTFRFDLRKEVHQKT